MNEDMDMDISNQIIFILLVVGIISIIVLLASGCCGPISVYHRDYKSGYMNGLRDAFENGFNIGWNKGFNAGWAAGHGVNDVVRRIGNGDRRGLRVLHPPRKCALK